MNALQQFMRAPKYISALGAWLWRTRPLVWVLVAIVVVLLLGVLISSCLERYVRISGMGLQLIGVILVGIGLEIRGVHSRISRLLGKASNSGGPDDRDLDRGISRWKRGAQ